MGRTNPAAKTASHIFRLGSPFYRLAKVLFMVVIVGAWLCIWGMFYRTGMAAVLEDIRLYRPFLPGTGATGTGVPIMQHFFANICGHYCDYGLELRRVDKILTVLIAFFEPVVNGRNHAVSLQALEFGGQMMATLILVEIEARRIGNTWGRQRHLQWSTAWLLLSRIGSFGAIMPIYYFYHILTSPARLGPGIKSPNTPQKDIMVNILELTALPFAVVLGFALPAYWMCIPASSRWFLEKPHQYFVAFWQGYPLWIHAYQNMLLYILYIPGLLRRAYTGETPEPRYQSSSQRNADVLSYLRWVYIFAFAVGTVSHISAWALSLSYLVVPGLFNSAKIISLSPADVWLADPPWYGYKLMGTQLARGVHNFLVYDDLWANIGLILWAMVLKDNVRIGRAPVTWRYWVSFFVKTVALSLVVGPASTAVLLVWARDELVLGDITAKAERKL